MLKRILAVTALSSAFMMGSAHAKLHPQDGLTAEEISQVKSVLLANKITDKKSLYPLFELLEPTKDEVYNWRKTGRMPDRKALVHFRKNNTFYKTYVNITKRTAQKAKKTRGQPMILMEEFFAAAEAVLSNKEFVAALAKRGLKPEQVHCIPLTAGSFGSDINNRIMKVPCLVTNEGENLYSKPVEGLYGTFDVSKGKILEVVDLGVQPMPKNTWNYTEEAIDKTLGLRPKWNPVKLQQKGKPNYKIDGSMVEWDIWKFHYRIDKRPGLVVSNIQANDGKKWRDVIYQAHLSEVFVPYMDPDKTWNYRTYMDSGEYGFGLFLTPLLSGIDCPSYSTFLPAVMSDDTGSPMEVPNAICIFERDTGNPGWRHYEVMKTTPENPLTVAEGRPQTELVVRTASEVGNYDYLIDYVFQQNGDIRMKVGATGLDAVKAVKSINADSPTYKEDTKYGSLIAPNLVGVNHDHYFNFRIDMDVDGRKNMPMATKIVPMNEKVEGNPRGTMWKVKNEMIHSEMGGSMKFSASKPKHFMLMNTNKKGPLNLHPGYMVHHGNIAYGPFDFENDISMKRNAYIKNSLWTTEYDPNERYAGGEYVFGSDGTDTLADWVKEDKDLMNKDVVTWFTAGFHHIPRTEDWPVMTTEWKQVHLQPMNFFPYNPSITVRKPESEVASISDTNIAKSNDTKNDADALFNKLTEMGLIKFNESDK